MIKKILIFIFITIFVVYLSESFVMLSFNPLTWGLVGRLTALVVLIVINYFGIKDLSDE